jgi:lambda family phage portal protein
MINETGRRIQKIWANNGHVFNVVRGRPRKISFYRDVKEGADQAAIDRGLPIYSGSEVTNTTMDFLGDWRAADSWMRFDMWRVRNRSRQLERGNPWCIALKRNMINNVLGFKGFHWKPDVTTSKQNGDTTEGEPDKVANMAIKSGLDEFGQPENLTTRKLFNRLDLDRLLVSRLIFDGEFILRRIRGFRGNDFGYAWQVINSDYLDYNLNRVEPNGNQTKMGVELDKDYKFPVAYWFRKRRMNDYFYNYATLADTWYYRVPAEEIIHYYLITDDDEQTRGWPWIFAAVVALFRMGKYQEAALVNAAIGASRGVYFEKKYPEGFVGDPRELEDESELVIDLPQGSALELPYGVVPHAVDMRYPDQSFSDFNNALLLTASAVFGTSYATTTGDLSRANFVSSRMGQIEEREHYKSLQETFIQKWKKPAYGEELYRAMLVGKVPLPVSKFDKFNKFLFTGRRWQFVQPVDDMKAKEMALNNLTCSISDVIEETTQEDAETVFERIDKDNKLMEKYNLTRIVSGRVASAEAVGEEQPGSVTLPTASPGGPGN